MEIQDIHGRMIRLTDERLNHLETDHPEMQGQISKIVETLKEPNQIVLSKTDMQVELSYKYYATTPVTNKFLCVVVKVMADDNFIITSYFTNDMKKGDIIWEKK